MCCSVFQYELHFWKWIFQFLVASKGPQLFCPALVWMNVNWITTISLLQWKLLTQFLLMMEINCFMVYFNFTLQCQHFDIFLFYQWNILVSGTVFLVTGVDISVKTYEVGRPLYFLKVFKKITSHISNRSSDQRKILDLRFGGRNQHVCQILLNSERVRFRIVFFWVIWHGMAV